MLSNDTFRQALANVADQQLQDKLTKARTPSLQAGAGLYVIQTDLKNLSNPTAFAIPGFAVTYSYGLSNLNGKLLVNGIPIGPGVKIGGYFEQLVIQRDPAFPGAIQGKVSLVVQTREDAYWEEPVTAPGVDLLASKTDWVAANWNGVNYLGPDGNGGFVLNATAANVPVFDVTPYKALLLLSSGTWTGVGVTLQFGIHLYDDYNQALAADMGQTFTTTAALGDPLTVVAGANYQQTSTAGDSILSAGHHAWNPIIQLPYCRPQLFGSGDPVALTKPRTFLYGVRG